MGTDIWDGVLPSCEVLDEDLAGKMGGSGFWSIRDEVRGERLGRTSEGRVGSPREPAWCCVLLLLA